MIVNMGEKGYDIERNQTEQLVKKLRTAVGEDAYSAALSQAQEKKVLIQGQDKSNVDAVLFKKGNSWLAFYNIGDHRVEVGFFFDRDFDKFKKDDAKRGWGDTSNEKLERDSLTFIKWVRDVVDAKENNCVLDIRAADPKRYKMFLNYFSDGHIPNVNIKTAKGIVGFDEDW